PVNTPTAATPPESARTDGMQPSAAPASRALIIQPSSAKPDVLQPASPADEAAAAPRAAAPRSESPAKPPAAQPTPQNRERHQYLTQLRVKIHQQLLERLDVQNLRSVPQEKLREDVRALVRELCQSEKGLISGSDQDRLLEDILDETFGLGPLEPL